MVSQQTIFPVIDEDNVTALSEEPVILDGMKVLFDEKTGFYPVDVVEKKRKKKRITNGFR